MSVWLSLRPSFLAAVPFKCTTEAQGGVAWGFKDLTARKKLNLCLTYSNVKGQSSPKRVLVMDTIISEADTFSPPKETKLKSLRAARRVDRHDSVITFQELFPFVVAVLAELEHDQDGDTAACFKVKEGFGNQINPCRDRGLNPGPLAQKSDTLPPIPPAYSNVASIHCHGTDEFLSNTKTQNLPPLNNELATSQWLSAC
uniref:Uncharacterized protein n=1 Tax=Timema poppense TaxID=170557 RepID=A0A7R9HD75_TIMPO|nr:unnamed protein product [Timema poppensis]